jgi:hypothetical protein
MGFDRNRVRFMIAHDFVGIGKWLPGKPQASVYRGTFRQRKVSAKAERCSVLMTMTRPGSCRRSAVNVPYMRPTSYCPAHSKGNADHDNINAGPVKLRFTNEHTQ